MAISRKEETRSWPGPSRRPAFGIPPGVVWLNTAHQGPLPLRAAEAARQAIARKVDPSLLEDAEFFEAPDRLRNALAALLGRPAGEIALGNSASHGLHVLANGLGLGRGDEVLLVRDDFPATVLPWLPLRERGVRIRFLPNRASVSTEAVASALMPETRLVCITWVDSFSGDVLDIDGVGRACHGADALLVLNATQGVGVRPLRVGTLPVDALVCAGYKWLCGPYGTGFSWLSPAVSERLRTGRRYWLPLARAHGLADLRDLLAVPPPSGAARVDVFGTASFFNVRAWTASIEYLREVGIDAVADHNCFLVTALRRVLIEHGCVLDRVDDGDAVSPLLFFAPPAGGDAAGLAARMRAHGVHVAVREGQLRLSPHLHNDETDVAAFDRALGSALTRRT